MADEPLIYVRERRAGREVSSLIVGKLPEHLTRKIGVDPVTKLPIEPRPYVYALRLDKLPNFEELKQLTIAQLDAMYERAKTTGKLPPENLTDPPKTGGGRGRKLGEWWEPPAKTWEDRPADPYPVSEAELADMRQRNPFAGGG